jgi:glucokinase
VRLAGDIGGTRARLVLLEPAGRVVRRQVFESRAFPSLEAVVRTFLGKPAPRIDAAAFGVAGPVVDGR